MEVLDFFDGWGAGVSGTPTICSLFENLNIWEVISV